MKFKWERISGSLNGASGTHRAKVIGGWIVESMYSYEEEEGGNALSSIFVPDPNHEWDIEIDLTCPDCGSKKVLDRGKKIQCEQCGFEIEDCSGKVIDHLQLRKDFNAAKPDHSAEQ